jgi:metallo-beta-lactamase family protein
VAPDPFPSGGFDAVVTESTYGDRSHDNPNSEFEDIITRTLQRGGIVLIPAFAVDRTEVILMRLREAMQSGRIPRVDVYADSPMALSSLRYYREAIDAGSPEIRPDVADQWQGRDPFDPGTLREMNTVEQSKSLNDVTAPSIIVSASGMATGGRVVHHLAHLLPNAKNTVLLVGYQAMGTRGWRLQQGEPKVKIHGEWVEVQAEIASVESFSVHADADEILAWLKPATGIRKIFVVHGEPKAAQVMARRVRDELHIDAQVPEPGEKVSI